MKFLVKVMDLIILQFLWIGYVIYRSVCPEKKLYHSIQDDRSLSQDETKNKRHFIHLYTTTSMNGKPVCYMDVYQIYSASDEEHLRSVCSKGVPNKTYYRHKERLTKERSYIPDEWKDYSIMAV
ncbi:uncharacterized protein LOC126890579 [Diabrotica virgifera virgifera]|uniref:Uncharacterized protein LOC114341244 n=1 Tax=Diabrotica virgifera virgifera TaxID=50390 RepID=A0A6P7GE80_DIAVI|nr:uncharacterized protein LOC126890579 [Diabrotica virgifera virgifera]